MHSTPRDLLFPHLVKLHQTNTFQGKYKDGFNHVYGKMVFDDVLEYVVYMSLVYSKLVYAQGCIVKFAMALLFIRMDKRC